MSQTQIFSGGGAWTLDDARWDGVIFSAGAQDTSQNGVVFSVSGTSMYMCGDTGNEVNQYNLTTPFDLSTASFSQVFNVSAQGAGPRGVSFRTNGLKMFVAGNVSSASDGEVNEYTLASAWNVSSASFLTGVSVSANSQVPNAAAFRNNGTKMFIIYGNTIAINEYSLASAWTVSGASFTQSFDVSNQFVSPTGLFIRSDGLKAFVGGNARVAEYTLTSAWDISTSTFVQSFSPSGDFAAATFRDDGNKMYTLGGNNVRQFSL